MGLRQLVIDLLSRGTPPELDEDELVHVEDVPLGMGQTTVEALRNEGIEAVAIEDFNAVIGASTSAAIMVPRRQHAEATAFLDTLR